MIYEKSQEKFDLILLDMIMPVMNGKDCFRKLKELNPEVKVILSSVFSKEEDLQDLKTLGLSNFIRKPYRSSSLSEIIHETLHSQPVKQA